MSITRTINMHKPNIYNKFHFNNGAIYYGQFNCFTSLLSREVKISDLPSKPTECGIWRVESPTPKITFLPTPTAAPPLCAARQGRPPLAETRALFVYFPGNASARANMMVGMARKCFLKCFRDLHAPIVLVDGRNHIIGRSKETKIRDKRCSKSQVELLADYSSYTVTVRQLGANTTGVNGKPLEFGNTSVLRHNDSLEILLGEHLQRVEFDPPPDSTAEKDQAPEDMPRRAGAASKRRAPDEQEISAMSKRTKPNKSEESGGWEEYFDGNLLVYKKDMEGREKIAGYDMDSTLITTKSGKVFAQNYDDWKILYSEIPGKLKQLYNDGYKIVIFTNQAGISRGKQTVSGIQKKICNIIDKFGVPIQAFVSTGKGKWRKPCTGMWEFLKEEANGNVTIDMSKSMYIGDAAGRPAEGKKKKDFSTNDRLFALNLGLSFYTPEEHFLGVKTQKFIMPDFDPRVIDDSVNLFEPPTTKVPKFKTEVVILVGYPGAGKSYLAEKHFAPLGYVVANRDTVGTWQKCVAIMEKSVQEGKHVVIDNTNPDIESRKRYVLAAKKLNIPVRCFVLSASKDHSRHNNKFREFLGADHSKVSDMIYHSYSSKYEDPSLDEGFEDIVQVNFVPKFRTKEEEEFYKMFLLEK
ncbi:uncharacterized protein F21D5.5-like [Penaeus japonicus]|uniref:uncharacterized protein F21D5.5-like n=1 Tax=Penaeus japonicus TaxID=27405 RepID=UPI001C711098|nr:uncharacterized protein F21D5.5-like [Penaeus japonicus]